MIIVKVEKKNDSTVTLYFDNGEKFFFSYELFLKNGLRKNMEISESRFSVLKEENEIFLIKKAAYNLIGRRNHSGYELKLKLQKKGYDNSLILRSISELRTKGYIDEKAFAKEFYEEKNRKGWGINKIKAELIKRGVPKDIIEDLSPGSSELDKALAAGTKKYKVLSARERDVKKLKMKLYAYLTSKGFDFEISREAILKLTGNNEED